ncbi:SGNH/GDSL hydrolase family protein [uncultured Winogradskyella sp.]|uniref:SGNH/GDSL hydrolase family protein n=1 Tax=uncultured Winogradskyella sp. TaxID=395353 RepID=UPI002623DB6A|nr:SGNH/GDSL hydrolase family protein [uncultured Winogradskyella sp.]
MKKVSFILLSFISLFACKSDEIIEASNDDMEIEQPQNYNLLSLGDSYTIGQSVCDTCRFPEQLKHRLSTSFDNEDTYNLNVIAQTGWTTTDLIAAIVNENLGNNYDLVTLLIGVNNQYQNDSFSLYEDEFPELVNTAITLAKNDKNNLIVISIPDYAYTPFGQGNGNPEITSQEIDMYNTFAENYCMQQNITFVNITDITRNGLDNTALVASDGLHPSELAYSLFVERLLPIAISKIQ